MKAGSAVNVNARELVQGAEAVYDSYWLSIASVLRQRARQVPPELSPVFQELLAARLQAHTDRLMASVRCSPSPELELALRLEARAPAYRALEDGAGEAFLAECLRICRGISTLSWSVWTVEELLLQVPGDADGVGRYLDALAAAGLLRVGREAGTTERVYSTTLEGCCIIDAL